MDNQNPHQILEVFSGDPATRVDRENGIIYGVRILGDTSRNKRKYTPEAITKALPLYEGKSVNANHERRADVTRPIEDAVGWLRNVREEKGGLTGDLHLLKSDPRFSKICEAAERNPTLFGLSHDADGVWDVQNGIQVVKEIERVRSVDIVSDPATTRSLFESYNGGNPMDPTVATPTAPGGSEMTWQMFCAKAEELFKGDGDPAGKAKGIGNLAKTLLKVQSDIEGAAATTPAATPAAPAAADGTTPEACADPKMKESFQKLQAENAKLKAESEARRLIESAKLPATDALVEAVAVLDTPEKRKALLESFKTLIPDERAKSASPATRMTESKGSEVPAKDQGDFLSKITRR